MKNLLMLFILLIALSTLAVAAPLGACVNGLLSRNCPFFR